MKKFPERKIPPLIGTHSLVDKQAAEIHALQQKIATLQKELALANEQLIYFQEQVKLGRLRQFGKKSEKKGLFDDNESDEVDVDETPSADNTSITITYTRPKKVAKKKTKGRNIDTRHLPREQVIHDLTESEKVCQCGCQLTKMGQDVSETLEVVPEILKVIEHITPKYTCRACETIKAAKKPQAPLPKCMAGSSLIADVIIKKYDHHLPLYRQSKILEQNNIIIPDNTLGNWAMGAADGLAPLGAALWNEIPLSHHMQLDETTVKILRPDKKGYMWVYQSQENNNRYIIYEFDLSREGSVPEKRMKHFTGLLQTDGYSGYKAIGSQSDVIHLGCWDHARRKFMDVLKINNNDKSSMAYECLTLIDILYDIESDIKEASDNARYVVRQEKSKPILEVLFNKVKTIKAPKKGALATAITYLKNNEVYLQRYIEHGQAHISNILTENKIRPFALGRKNWLFVGNATSANKSALLYSLIETCKINKINPRKYLIYALNNVHALRRNEMDAKSLLPQYIDPELLK